jgi:hypothetical protein
MPIINSKQSFINELKKYVDFSTTTSNIESNFSSNIKIEERTDDGKGEIYLDISSYTDDTFFVKINHCSNHNIGTEKSHCDGIVLKVNLINKNIGIYCFELKKQLRFSNLEKALKQLANAYKFINYLQFEKCFALNYKFFIVYKDNNIDMDADSLKNGNQYHIKLFESVYENKNKVPLMIAFCKYEEFNFQQVEFGEEIAI